MRILCVCSHGNVRSVALAYLLKTIYKHEAIAIGWKDTSKETFSMLSKWADRIVALDTDIWNAIVTPELTKKMMLVNVGKDIWHQQIHQELLYKLYKHLKEFDI